MFGLFKSRTWQAQSAMLLEGAYGDIKVALSNFPYRLDTQSGRRRLLGDGFGNRFLTQLKERALPNFETIASRLNTGSDIEVQVRVGDETAIGVKISGRLPASSRQFYSDLAEALIQAFRSQGIH